MARTKIIEVPFESLPDEPPLARRKPGTSPLGEWFQRHPKITYTECARAVRRTKSSIQMIAVAKAEPGLKIAGRLELWTRSKDPNDYVRMQAWVA